MKRFHIHLVSDATGETINAIARACLVQFENVEPVEHVWSMVRSERQLDKVLAGVGANPGVVLFTLVDEKLRNPLLASCRALNVPCIPVLDPVLAALAGYLNARMTNLPGRQHALDAGYFARIEAINYVMAHDDGQATHDLEQADVVLVGVSRTSKTPTCIYLANRGVKAANVPFISGCPLPPEIDELKKPLIVGLTNDPTALVHVRRNRLTMLNEGRDTQYTDIDSVKAEVAAARRLFNERGWPILDVSRRSIEETAATILELVNRRRETAASGNTAV
ncbi:MAG: kinase/pyrophosphorylase [Rhodospirillales bacterium]|nr:kinase/pyrophosphorylase [Rhodospirillales bacterium]